MSSNGTSDNRPRPFYEWLKRTGRRDGFFTDMPFPGDNHVTIRPIDKWEHWERLTGEEYAELMGLPLKADPATTVEVSPLPFSGGVMVQRGSWLKDGEAGIIIPPSILKDDDGSLATGAGLSTTELRLALMLWDRLDWPYVDLVPEHGSAETDFLMAEGVLFRSSVTYMGGTHSKDDIIGSGNTVAQMAEVGDPGRWVVGRGASGSSDIAGGPDRSLIIELGNALALPDAEVPLEEVLAFRDKRKSELMKLRYHMAELRQKIMASPDQAFAFAQESAGLSQAIIDQRRVMAERWHNKLYASIAANVKIEKWGAAGAAFYATYTATNNVASAALAGVGDRKSTRLNSSHSRASRMPSSA